MLNSYDLHALRAYNLANQLSLLQNAPLVNLENQIAIKYLLNGQLSPQGISGLSSPLVSSPSTSIASMYVSAANQHTVTPFDYLRFQRPMVNSEVIQNFTHSLKNIEVPSLPIAVQGAKDQKHADQPKIQESPKISVDNVTESKAVSSLESASKKIKKKASKDDNSVKIPKKQTRIRRKAAEIERTYVCMVPNCGKPYG